MCQSRIKTGNELLKNFPEFPPAYNNMAIAAFYLGKYELAQELSEKALAIDPSNIHALGNMIFNYVFLSNSEGTMEASKKIKQILPENPLHFRKKAEALTMTGDDLAVLETVKQARKAQCQDDVILLHLAGVAAVRIGKPENARKLFNEALEYDDGQYKTMIEDNLTDLDQPVNKQNGPWPFHLETYIHHEVLEYLKNELQKTPEELEVTWENLINRFPSLHNIFKIVLSRGSSWHRRLITGLIDKFPYPENLELLREYAMSSYGSEEQRFKAVKILLDHGFIEEKQIIKFWKNGRY